MSPVSATCPACGAPIVFGVDTSLVAVCKACDSIVGRGDQKLEDLGKVSRLTETGAVLEKEMMGRFEGKRFQLTGRTQLKHEAGGVWDEWYLHFDDGRWGWLAEAQGKYFLTFSADKLKAQTRFDRVELGKNVAGLPGLFVAAEKGVATAISAEGELPYMLKPGEQYYYVDLAGSNGAFGTIDYSEDPARVFVGKELTLAELGVTPKKRIESKRTTTATQVSCPNCGAPLALRAPDKSERVTCPSCSSLLDCNEGALKFLRTLKQPAANPTIPLGSKGTLFGVEWLLLGYVRKSVTYEGTKYPWDEYLLYEPAQGFRWLVCAEGHWNFGAPLSVAEVQLGAYGRTARHGKDSYRLFQDGKPRVDGVYGEFYWQVNEGDTAKSSDFIRPPYMISYEEATYATGSEINWTRLTYVEADAVKTAFKLKTIRTPQGIAPNQLFPHKPIFKLWRRASLALVGLWLLLAMGSADRELFKNTIEMEPVKSNEATAVFFSEPFEMKGDGNVEVTLSAPVDNTWVYVQGDLINNETGLVQEFDAPLEYYSGVDDGESWSEGSRDKVLSFPKLPAGNYSLRVETQWEQYQSPVRVSVQVKEDVPDFGLFFLAFLGISLIPFITLIRNYAFDVRRWKTSDYSPYSSE